MRDEDLFNKVLADVPPVPPNVFTQIEKRIKGAAFRKQMFFTIAATILLLLGVSTWFLANQTPATDITITASLTSEVADELQIARDFMNSNDLENDNEQYAFFDSNEF